MHPSTVRTVVRAVLTRRTKTSSSTREELLVR